MENTAIGFTALRFNTGSRNTAIGFKSLYNNTVGYENTASGDNALSSNTSGFGNTANGSYALYSNTGGYENTANGYQALIYNTTGYFNTAIGTFALSENTIGCRNTVMGTEALGYIATGSDNTAMGYNAGSGYGNTSNSVFLGSNTRAQANNQANQIVIGYNAVGNGSNSVTLGSDAVTKTILKGNVGIGTAAPEYKLDVAGNIRTSGEFVTNEMTVSKSNSEIGGTLTLANPAKTAAGAASAWRIMNMGGNYGNSLQFWAYYNAGCPGGICAPQLVLMDNGKVGIGTSTPASKLEVADAAGGVLSITTKSNFGTLSTPLQPSIEFLGTQNSKKVRLSATQWGYLSYDSKFSISVNDGTSINNLVERFVILSNGNIGIGITPGTNSTDPKLDVNGVIRAQELRACVNMGCDYVFENDYKLMNLNDLSNFIKTNKHLPEVAPAAQMENEGIGVSEMNLLLLKKIEELTLYLIQLQETVDKQNIKIESLENKNK